jgi:hypothetical protein
MAAMPPTPIKGSDGCAYPFCEFGNGKKYDFVVLGDSHGAHLFSGLKKLAEKRGLSFAIFHFDGTCRFVNEPTANHHPDYDCAERMGDFKSFIEHNSIERVIVSHRWANVDGANDIGDSGPARRLAQLFTDKKMKSVRKKLIILNVPEFYRAQTPESCELPRLVSNFLNKNCDSRPRHDRWYTEKELLNSRFSAQPSLRDFFFLDPFDALCDTQSCYLKINDAFLYTDAHHLSDIGSDILIMRDGELFNSFLR